MLDDFYAGNNLIGTLAHQHVVASDVGLALGSIDNQGVYGRLAVAAQFNVARKRGAT